jgi:hypothetical protein
MAALLATACARTSPQLPPDLSHLPADQRLMPGDLDSPEAKLNCAALKQEAESTKASVKTYEAAIAANRGHNQGVGYFSAVLFPPLALAIRNDEEAKKSLDQLQTKADRLDRLSKAKGCKAAA